MKVTISFYSNYDLEFSISQKHSRLTNFHSDYLKGLPRVYLGMRDLIQLQSNTTITIVLWENQNRSPGYIDRIYSCDKFFGYVAKNVWLLLYGNSFQLIIFVGHQVWFFQVVNPLVQKPNPRLNGQDFNFIVQLVQPIKYVFMP